MDTWSNFVGSRGGNGVGHMMQQVKLPRSTLSGQSSSFMQELTMNLKGWTSYGYNMSLTWGDTVYVQVKNTLLTYHRSTKTQGDNIRMMGNYDENTRFVQIIVDKRAFLLSGYTLFFSVLDLESGQVTKLSAPPYGLNNYYNQAANILPVMRYDRAYNKIYAAIPIRYYPNNTALNGYELAVYDVASNTWTLLNRNPDFCKASNNSGKGCLIDFNEDTVKFVSNMGRSSGAPWSFTTSRNASPSGGVFNTTETIYTQLRGNTDGHGSSATIVQTDDKVFGLQGSKLFTFDLFTGETSDESLFGAVPVSNSGNYPAVQAYGCNYCDGKMWYCDGQRLFSLDYDLTVKPDGPLVWKIFKGQKYSAPDPITLHKPDGSTLEITAGQQEAAADIEIHIGEYDNNQTDKYLLIEN